MTNNLQQMSSKERLAHPIRSCAVCRKHQTASELLRFVSVNGEYHLVLKKGSLLGRSVYICPSSSCLQKCHSRLAPRLSKEQFLKRISEELAEISSKNDGMIGKKQKSWQILTKELTNIL